MANEGQRPLSPPKCNNFDMEFEVPPALAANCRKTSDRAAWLSRLSDTLRTLMAHWSIVPGAPFDSGAGWVAPATLPGGSAIVIKIGMPHMEGEHEIQGLRFWQGDATVRLLQADDELGAMLIERCEPGTALCELPEAEQDIVIAGLLRRLWRSPPALHPFRPLSALMQHWSDETVGEVQQWTDEGMVRAGLQLFQELPRSARTEVVLATDLHAGNVLRAQREPWLVIDPKPFVGDPAYDATQHLFNCRPRMLAKPLETIQRFAGLLGVDEERVRLWMFARAAAEPRWAWRDSSATAIARALGG